MDEMLAGAGILCILAAIMTRQLKAAGRNIPVLISSPRRQALLAALGAVLLGASFLAVVYAGRKVRAGVPHPPAPSPIALPPTGRGGERRSRS